MHSHNRIELSYIQEALTLSNIAIASKMEELKEVQKFTKVDAFEWNCIRNAVF
jgi:hypothetical protein